MFTSWIVRVNLAVLVSMKCLIEVCGVMSRVVGRYEIAPSKPCRSGTSVPVVLGTPSSFFVSRYGRTTNLKLSTAPFSFQKDELVRGRRRRGGRANTRQHE